MKSISDADTVDGSWNTNSDSSYSLNLNLIWKNKFVYLKNVQDYLKSLELNQDQILGTLPSGYSAKVNSDKTAINCN